MPQGQDERHEQVAANLASVRHRIARACHEHQRDPSEVTLIAVTKTRPASDVRLLASLGVTDVGENRDQEAGPKVAACADLDLRWHFVGQLQSNKARSVAEYAAMVHSIDRPSLVRALASAAAREDRVIDCLVQVALEADDDTERRRGGAPPARVMELADMTAGTSGLRLRGVMAVAPLATAGSPAAAGAAFERLARIAAEVRENHPMADVISAGMSGDLEPAIAAGATHVRVGTALLGSRGVLG